MSMTNAAQQRAHDRQSFSFDHIRAPLPHTVSIYEPMVNQC